AESCLAAPPESPLLGRVGRGGGAGGGRGAAGRGGFGTGGGGGQLLGHHADRPARRAVPDGVQPLHRAGVLRLVVRVEEDHRRPLRGFLRLGRAVPDLEAIDGVLVGERLVVHVEVARLV